MSKPTAEQKRWMRSNDLHRRAQGLSRQATISEEIAAEYADESDRQQKLADEHRAVGRLESARFAIARRDEADGWSNEHSADARRAHEEAEKLLAEAGVLDGTVEVT